MPESLKELRQRAGYLIAAVEGMIGKAGGSAVMSDRTDTPLYHARQIEQGLTEHIDGSEEPEPEPEPEPDPDTGVVLGLGGGANEPTGYEKILEWDCGHEFPVHYTGRDSDNCADLIGLDGSAVADVLGGGFDHEHLFDIDTDPTATVSGPEVLSIKYLAGHVGETLGVNLWAWKTPTTSAPCDVVNNNPDHHYDEVYIYERRKIWTDRAEGDVEVFNNGANHKFSHVKGHRGDNSDAFSCTLGPVTEDAFAFMSEFTMRVRVTWTDVDGTSQIKVYGQNVTDDALMVVGEWFDCEWQMVLNSIAGDGTANADGIIRCWINGVLVMEHTGVIFVTGFSEATREGFQNYDMSTTWNGHGETHTHDKGWYVDHIWISGVAA